MSYLQPPALVGRGGRSTIAIDVTLLVTLGSAPPEDKRQHGTLNRLPSVPSCPSPSISRAVRPPGPFSIDAKRRRICPILRRGLGGGGDRESLGQSRDVCPPKSPPPSDSTLDCIFSVRCSARRSQ
ncbi:hypothetical protein V2G26_009977 [Clonostachys chloroleuca]